MFGALGFLGIAVGSQVYSAILSQSSQASRAAAEIRRLRSDLEDRDTYYMTEDDDDDLDPEQTLAMLKIMYK